MQYCVGEFMSQTHHARAKLLVLVLLLLSSFKHLFYSRSLTERLHSGHAKYPRAEERSPVSIELKGQSGPASHSEKGLYIYPHHINLNSITCLRSVKLTKVSMIQARQNKFSSPLREFCWTLRIKPEKC